MQPSQRKSIERVVVGSVSGGVTEHGDNAAILAPSYRPNIGYLGRQELEVPNYLFNSKSPKLGYSHCRDVVQLLLKRPIEEQFRKSSALTQFLKKREMTFSKRMPNGEYNIFAVPCTTTPLTLPKSLFDVLERSTQVLVASLRLVLQDIYGSESVRSSRFVKSLSPEMRKQFILTVESSPHYFPQLHHPVMQAYPFFDVVGLDLVLSEDLADLTVNINGNGPRLVSPENFGAEARTKLPFALLEINAGSPSGASNNSHILEGLSQIDPDLLDKMGRVMPNDHFRVLRETYDALGKSWTGRSDGIGVILPPGGENGATPEIHQLAASSGLIYADSGQLYRDGEGQIRLRTVTGSDPIVSSIYSRVNSDAILFDPEKGIVMRDPEEGTPFYLCDPYTVDASGAGGTPVLDSNGKKIPMNSSYAIPGIVDALLDRKLYLGGLNRVLDNKIILSTLCQFAPDFFRTELRALGLDPIETLPLTPPETLPSNAETVELIEKNPEDWVIKAPNLSGGNGIYILKTMSQAERKQVLEKVRTNPKSYAYQRLVRIGRLPIAVKDKDQGHRYANIAADLRMWAFYGEVGSLPRLTHNALIRTAPEEKGPLSSIVNTSKGGGYSPMLVVDDVGHPEAISVRQLVQPLPPRDLVSDLPAFAGAQLMQIAHLGLELKASLQEESPDLWAVYRGILQVKKQCREVLSFLHPKNMEPVNELIDQLETRLKRLGAARVGQARLEERAQWVTLAHPAEKYLSAEAFSLIEGLYCIRASLALPFITEAEKNADLATLQKIRQVLRATEAENHIEVRRLVRATRWLITRCAQSYRMPSMLAKSALFEVQRFMTLAQDHLRTQDATRLFSICFASSAKSQVRSFDVLFATSPCVPSGGADVRARDLPIAIATDFETRTGKRLVDSDWIPSHLQAARKDWMQIEANSLAIPSKTRQAWIQKQRAEHFTRHPELKEYQALINSPADPNSDPAAAILKLMEILPYAKHNFEAFLKHEGLSAKEVFTEELTHRRISILDLKRRQAADLNLENYAGEAYARKREEHGLFSDSDIYLWVSKEISPFVQAYTVGHELIHFHQIKEMMDAEKTALKQGPTALSDFLNFFGNYLGLASGAMDHNEAHAVLERKRVHGFKEMLEAYPQNFKGRHWISELRKNIGEGTQAWNNLVDEYGSLLGMSMDVLASIKVKAMREVIPALENAKNIRFAKELGLELPLDEVRSALPTANAIQVERYRSVIERAVSKAGLDYEALRVIASHQYPGVYFPKTNEGMDPSLALVIRAPRDAISPGGGYNQTQQQ